MSLVISASDLSLRKCNLWFARVAILSNKVASIAR